MSVLIKKSKAHQSRTYIERLHVEMKHLLFRGFYKPLGKTGAEMNNLLLELNPEIYGNIGDEDIVEINGLLYIFERLPIGIEECRYIKLISSENFDIVGCKPIIPAKRRRNCFRIDNEQMYIEMTRGKSDVYDVLTHLTFLYNEAEKIGRKSLNSRNQPNLAFLNLERMVNNNLIDSEENLEVNLIYISELLGLTLKETKNAYESFNNSKGVNNLFSLVYYMGKLSIEEKLNKKDREVHFSFQLHRQLGQHVYGEDWAYQIKKNLYNNKSINSEIHIISANMHSVMNTIYAKACLGKGYSGKSIEEVALILNKPESIDLRNSIKEFALKNGMTELNHRGGTNISVQIFDIKKASKVVSTLKDSLNRNVIIIVMDYAFGEQAFETMDELLKPLEENGANIPLDIKSINIVGKAGILEGKKGDIMLPDSHIFEGNTDNYTFKNKLSKESFTGQGLGVYEGAMITVLGTSLQNVDVLNYFHKSSWKAIGLEMEGAHYQKAIQAASKIRKSISPDVELRYAYYASDNPLVTGATLASGSLREVGVKPTYAITKIILNDILEN